MAFDANFLKTLEALNLMARRVFAGDERAERRTPRKGASVEFSDYRPYASGDEIRYIDWNVYARHGSLLVKEFSAEQDVHATILLDVSGSMGFGGKFQAAKELAAALGYIGLAHYDSVSLYAFAQDRRPVRRFLRGKGRIFDLLAAVDGLETGGTTDLRAAFEAPLQRLRGRALALLLTDFYDARGYAEGVRSLLSQKFDVRLLHLVAHEEVAPTVRGRVNFVDLETGRRRDVTLRPRTVESYRRRFSGYCESIREFARAHELAYARILAEEPLDRRVLELLRAGGILEPR